MVSSASLFSLSARDCVFMAIVSSWQLHVEIGGWSQLLGLFLFVSRVPPLCVVEFSVLMSQSNRVSFVFYFFFFFSGYDLPGP
jgi:hypothetical protein